MCGTSLGLGNNQEGRHYMRILRRSRIHTSVRSLIAILVSTALCVLGVSIVSVGPAAADSVPWISIGDAAQVRPASGTATLVFPVKLVHPVQDQVSVSYNTADGTARSTNDYVATSGTLTFAPGKTSASVTVTINGSTLHTGNRIFYVNLTNAIGVNNNVHSQGTGTIVDPTPLDYVNISNATTTQGSGTASTAVFTLSLTAPSANPVSVAYTTGNGSAVAGADYTYAHGTVTFPPGTTTETVSVPVASISIYQGQKYFYLNINNPVNAAVGSGQGEAVVYNSNHVAYVTADDVTVSEPKTGTTSASVPVHLGAAANFPVTVAYQTSNGSAVAGTDFQTSAGTITIPAGTVSVNVPVTINSSGVTSTKSFSIGLNQPSAGATVWRSSANVTIVGSSTYEQLQVGDVSVVSPSSGTTNASFSVTLSPPSASAVTVNYATADGTATAGTHYTAASGSVTFSAGQTSKTVNVAVKADTAQFSDTYFYLNLSGASGATIERSSAYGIIETSQLSPIMSVSTPAVQKPASGTAAETFNITLSSASPNTVTVNYATQNGNASAGTDFNATSGTVTFPAGSTTQPVTVNVLASTKAGPNLYYYLQLTSPTNAQVAQSSTYGYIENPNLTPTLSISPAAVYKPQSGKTTVKATVTLSSSSVNTVTVNYSTQDGLAIAGTDYTAASGTLTFPPGATSETVSVGVTGNTLPTGDRYFYINLSGPVNASVVTSSAQVDIVDSSVVPLLSVTSTSVVKPASAAANAVFTVTLSPPSPNKVTVNYSTSDGNAIAGTDYSATNGTLTFPIGQASETVNVPVTASTVHKGDRYFYLNLTNPTNAVVGSQNSAPAYITDPSVNPILTVDDAGVLKPSSGTTTLTFHVHEYPATQNTVTVNYQTQDGSAVAGTDYVATSGTLTFPAGTTTQSVNVTVNGSSTSVSDRYFYLTIGSASNAQIPRSSGIGRIVDTVAPTSGLSYLTVSDAAIARPGSGTAGLAFTVGLFPAATAPVYVSYYTTDGTATAGGGDYQSSQGTLTFAAGATSQTINVTANGGDLSHGDRYFYLSLTNAIGLASIGRSSSYGYILNAQPDAYAWVGSSILVNRGDTGSQTVNETVTLSETHTYPVSVDYSTVDGSAVSPDGYNGTSGTINFAPGQTVATVPITIPGNPNFTSQQYFYFVLSNAFNATISQPTQYVYIDNLDDFAISGTVINPSGNGVSGVNVTRTGNNQPSVTVQTGSNGAFRIPNTVDGTYTITPNATGETFEPASVKTTVRGASPAATPFIGFAGTGIEGLVVNSAGKPVAGVSVALSGPASATTTTTSLGYYAFGSLSAASGYVVTPSKTGYTFNPAKFTDTLGSATLSNQDFVGVQGISITGRVTTSTGTGVSGVTVTRSGGGHASTSVKTNSQGYYGISSNPATAGGITYTITPSLTGGTFTPASASATVTSTTSASGVNFTKN
jgi:hypothetical protein